MAAMRVHVRSVQVLDREGLVLARVEAASERKVRGRPVARIELELTFRARLSEGAAAVRARARDAALRLLDVE